jgi:hypothetical protein
MSRQITDDFETDLIMAARYAYYVMHAPFLEDQDYDAREKEYHLTHAQLPVGSDQRADYTEAQRALAMYFIFSGRTVKQFNPEDML